MSSQSSQMQLAKIRFVQLILMTLLIAAISNCGKKPEGPKGTLYTGVPSEGLLSSRLFVAERGRDAFAGTLISVYHLAEGWHPRGIEISSAQLDPPSSSWSGFVKRFAGHLPMAGRDPVEFLKTLGVTESHFKECKISRVGNDKNNSSGSDGIDIFFSQESRVLVIIQTAPKGQYFPNVRLEEKEDGK